jgi:hypothetical protein
MMWIGFGAFQLTGVFPAWAVRGTQAPLGYHFIWNRPAGAELDVGRMLLQGAVIFAVTALTIIFFPGTQKPE